MIQLIQGDSLEQMKAIPDASIDLTVTSPPYDDLRTYNGNIDQWNEDKWKAIIKDLYRITKDNGVIVWIVADQSIKGSESGTSFKQALWAIECGFALNDTMIWNKGNFSTPGAINHRYAQVFEYMFIWTKGSNHTFNPIKDRKNKKFGIRYTNTIRQRDGSIKDGHGKGIKTIAEYGIRHNVWNMPPENSNSKRCHPAQYPEHLVNDHILSWSNENDTVFDPFMGSGTTGIVAKKLKRNFIGIELDQDYFQIASNRINSISQVSSLDNFL